MLIGFSLALVLAGCHSEEKPADAGPAQDQVQEGGSSEGEGAGAPLSADDVAANITAVEERLLAIYPEMSQFGRELGKQGAEAVRYRLHAGAALLQPQALGEPASEEDVPGWAAQVRHWAKNDHPPVSYDPDTTDPLAWLKPLLPEYDKVGIKNVDGELVRYGDTFAFRSHHRFHFRSSPGAAQKAEVDAEVTIDWGSDGTRLKIIRWQLGEVVQTVSGSAEPLVGTPALHEAVTDPATHRDLLESRHEEFLRGVYANPEDLRRISAIDFPLDHIEDVTFEAGEQHPAVSVVDLDQDGWDDLYLVRRWGRNRFLRSNGDGTFTEEAEARGLDIDRFCSCAIFADFDNDGDDDLFLGRTLERSRLLENVDGVFRDVSHQIHGVAPPHLVASMSAADYDGDGLLDLYIGTYYGHTQGRGSGWEEKYLEPEHRAEHAGRYAGTEDQFYDFAGPPNLLLRNRGSMRFERAPEDPEVRSWRATLQPTWSDWDGDGDPDLLVTNDFGPDQMFRNDPHPDPELAKDGRRRFTDVAEQLAPGAAQNYFGMGGSWGDFNLDGVQDLYLSAMFSKAGTRITRRLDFKSPRATTSAMGNILLASTGSGRWEQVSGHGPGQQPVNKVGWAWGGQFFDPNNDGYLDLYAPTGYFTPPPEFSSAVDY